MKHANLFFGTKIGACGSISVEVVNEVADEFPMMLSLCVVSEGGESPGVGGGLILAFWRRGPLGAQSIIESLKNASS